jgi:hypothetical protein
MLLVVHPEPPGLKITVEPNQDGPLPNQDGPLPNQDGPLPCRHKVLERFTPMPSARAGIQIVTPS